LKFIMNKLLFAILALVSRTNAACDGNPIINSDKIGLTKIIDEAMHKQLI